MCNGKHEYFHVLSITSPVSTRMGLDPKFPYIRNRNLDAVLVRPTTATEDIFPLLEDTLITPNMSVRTIKPNPAVKYGLSFATRVRTGPSLPHYTTV